MNVRPTLLLTGCSSRRVQSPSSKSNDTLSGISSIEPSKHSGSSHSLASVRSQGGDVWRQVPPGHSWTLP